MKTVSLQLAQELRKAGFPQGDTHFLWYTNGDSADLIEQVKDMRPMEFKSFDAPTAEEILDELPAWMEFEEDKGRAYLRVDKYSDVEHKDVKYQIYYKSAYAEYANPLWQDSLAEAAGKMWLYLKKEGLL